MKASDFIQTTSRLSGTIKSDVVKRYLCFIIAVAVIGTLGPITLSKRVNRKQYLPTSSSFVFHQQASDNLNKDKYAVLNQDVYTIKDYEAFHKFFSLDNFKPLISPIYTNWEIFLDAGKSSPYISFFASLPLRSPPLYS